MGSRLPQGKCSVFSLIILAGAIVLGQEKISVPVTPETVRENLSVVEKLRNQADYDRGLSMAQESLRQAEELGEDELITEALFQLSLIHYFLESFEEARVYMEIGLTHARLHSLKNMEGDFLNAQGVLEWKQGNLFEATAKLKEALAIKQTAGQWVGMASISNNLGIIYYSLKQYPEAVKNYEQGLEWLGDNDNNRMRASLHSNIGESLIPLGKFAEAESHLKKSLEIELAEGEPLNLAYTYFNLGELRSGQGQPQAAIDLYQTALQIQLDVNNTWAAALTRLKLSEEYLAIDDVPTAVEVLKAGYEDVKELNSLPMLRDYSGQFSILYEKAALPGRSKYYSDLHQWFKDRLDSIDLGPRMSRPPDSVELVNTLPVPPRPDFSMIRIATLGLLGVLILFLVVENFRLRKEMAEK
jgi:tetratricopeptide (TPR) repeat protein